MPTTKHTPQEEGSGLSGAQVDAITLEICHAQALTTVLFEQASDEDEISASLFPILRERLEKISTMVLHCHNGGRS
jgi:hypothetical protein